MTYESKLKEFYSGFGLTAFPSTAVPDDAVLPYLVYEVPYGGMDSPVSGTVNLYYHTESEGIPNAKAEEIRKAIGSGVSLRFDDGVVYIFKGSPEQLNLSYQDEPSTKLRQLNITYSICRKEL